MKKLIHTILVLSISILISSCAKMEVLDFNKDNYTRSIKFTYQNDKSKLVSKFGEDTRRFISLASKIGPSNNNSNEINSNRLSPSKSKEPSI